MGKELRQEKMIYLDLETTGTAVDQHGIVQLAAIVEIGGDIVDEMTLDMAPITGDIIEQQALAVSGIPLEGIFQRMPAKEAYGKFTAMVCGHVDRFNKQDKFHLAGYNILGFDAPFLRRWFEKNGDKWFGSYFWFPSIDVMAMAADYVAPYRHTLENFKLATVCRAFGIEVDETKLHDALYDVRLTRELYQTVSRLRDIEGGKK